jgi:hypothetical protein
MFGAPSPFYTRPAPPHSPARQRDARPNRWRPFRADRLHHPRQFAGQFQFADQVVFRAGKFLGMKFSLAPA